LFTIGLQKRFNDAGLRAKAVTVNPGSVKTELFRSFDGSWLKRCCLTVAFKIATIGLLSE